MTKNDILSRLTTRSFGQSLHLHETIDSTNTRAKTIALDGAPHGTVVFSEFQTAGRGRLGRHWDSTAGENLTFSVILRSGLSTATLGILPLLTGVAVVRSIQLMTGLDAKCKWPNDVLVGRKKVCGILCESLLRRDQVLAAILGIGINVNQRTFEDGLSHHATSLAILQDCRIDRVSLFCAVLAELESLCEVIHNDDVRTILDMWKQVTTTLGTRIDIRDGAHMYNGIAVGVADNGGLLLETDDGLKTILAGDVTTLAEG